MDRDEQEALDALGIPGWGRVEKLARALIQLQGLSLTRAEADEIKKLYNNMLDYDKHPLQFQQRTFKANKGEICEEEVPSRRQWSRDSETVCYG